MARLLIVGCSQRKNRNASILPAVERYDGVAFRTLRRWLRCASSASLDVLILSAAFGVVYADDQLPDYDVRMTAVRANELRSTVDQVVGARLASTNYRSVFLDLGKTYRRAIDHTLFRSSGDVAWATGSIGARAAQLKHWLESTSSSPMTPAIPAVTNGWDASQGVAMLCGHKWCFSPDEIWDKAHSSLQLDPTGAENWASWYVKIDGRQVAPKWLVRQLTGLAVSAFSTSEARRFLHQLGVPVQSLYAVAVDQAEPC